MPTRRGRPVDPCPRRQELAQDSRPELETWNLQYLHPELTGRENVFLSGAILGTGNREIARKFDEIVAFAEVKQFIDTPLKHFSTGMQMRLAVAAQLEPEIPLVDEVLAVGDLEFQKKCLGKMSEVSKGGRTIVFVSHQMSQIRRLYEHVIWVDRGVIQQDGPTIDVVSAYEATFAGQLEVDGLGKQDLGHGIQFVKWNSLSSTNRLLEIQNIGQEPPLIADGVGSGNASVCRINT